MKIAVTVAEAAGVEDDFQIVENAIADRALMYELNEWDEFALEEAVSIAEDDEDVEVVSVTVGPERAEERIRMALAKGADRAVRVWDEALSDEPLLDPSTKARILAAVLEEEAPDLVLAGVQTGDDAFGATGVALAEELGFAWTSVVVGADSPVGDGSARVRRELEGGVDEILDVDLPAVLAIQTGMNEPRYASLRGIRQAQRKPLDVRTFDDLDLDSGTLESTLEIVSMTEPTAESDVTYFEGSPADTAAALTETLADLEVIAL